MKRLSALAAALLFTVCAVSSSYAIAGLGFHWGWDFSLGMKDGDKDAIKIDGLGDAFNITVPNPNPLESPIIIPVGAGQEFLYISRSDWKRSNLNFGGKLYFDVVPVVKMLEASFNIGVWQYQGVVNYLDTDLSAEDLGEFLGDPANYKIPYRSSVVTLDAFGMKKYLGLTETPYAKLQFDATIRPFVFKAPFITASAGGGLSLHFSTPLLSSFLVEDVRLDKGLSPEDFIYQFENDKEIGKAILKKITDELFTPRYGMHIVAGAQIKPPVFPFGIYVDGKLMIPFSKFDENKQINAVGFMFNTGISLSI